MGLSRSSLYYIVQPASDWEVRVKHRIDAIYTEQPFYGSRRIPFLLEEEGFEIGRDAVRKFMREMGITAIYPKPNTSKPAPENKIYPYLLRGVTSAYPNHIWGIDITYIVRHEVACRIVMRSIPDMTGCPITRTLRGDAAR